MKSPDYYIEGVLAGNRRAMAKTITLIESSLTAHRETSREVLTALLPYSGKAVRLGITGVPGVGKSTFVESLGLYLTEKGLRVAVLAVDPSSSRSGGSILGDKTRMEKLSAQPLAFIRPSPSGGTLGGVARKTRETMIVCEAAGYDVVIVETVGVGQSEITVESMVDFFMVLMLAGAGDELQGIKKGILELADAIVINKADGDNVENARRARTEYETALHMLSVKSALWDPPVLTASALNHEGIEDSWRVVSEYVEKMRASGDLEETRKKQALDWMWAMIDEGLKDRFMSHPEVVKVLPEITRKVEGDRMPPTSGADLLLSLAGLLN